MLHKLKNAHREILRGLPELKGLLPRPARNKQLLLEMARRKEKRPSRTHPIGKRLSDYTIKVASSYDPAFDKQIRKLAPHWFVSKSETVAQRKRQLLEMAERGRQKPPRGSQLVGLLYKVTNENSPAHDPVFTKKIKALAPHWFIAKSQPKKDLLLKIAKDKSPKPKERDPLCSALRRYTRKDSNCHDPVFTKKIKALAPHWFVPTSRANKDLLVDMARKRDARPNYKTKIGRALINYTRKTSFVHDPAFTQKIRKLAPHWFKRCSTR